MNHRIAATLALVSVLFQTTTQGFHEFAILSSSNPTYTSTSTGPLNGLFADVLVGAGQEVHAVSVTSSGSVFADLIFEGQSWRSQLNSPGGNLLDYPFSAHAPTTLGEGTGNLFLDSFSGPFTVTLEFSPLNRGVQGTVAQAQFAGTSFQMQTLRHNFWNALPSYQGTIASSSTALSPPIDRFNNSGVALVSYEEPLIELASYQDTVSRTASGRIVNNGWGGWMQGYGIGGDVDDLGAGGFDYAAGGTQLGLFRQIDRCTQFGLFGGYGYQNVDGTDNSETNVNSGMIGTFLHRSDHCGNYYFLAGNIAYDDYDTRRTATARGSFDGVQNALYLERGVNRQLFGRTIQPSAALQYIWLYQDDYAERGAGAVTFDDLDAHSLRSIVGATVFGNRQFSLSGKYCWTPNARAHWMHEFLETSTSVTGNLGVSSFSAQGLDLGRDWALLGVGLIGNRNSAVSLYSNYDLQLNDRQTFHTGSLGAMWQR